MTISCIEDIFKKYVAIAKNQHPKCFAGKYSPHTMRHTTATHMVEAGIPLLVIKNFLGHVSFEATQVYAKVTEQHFNSHVSKWNAHWLQSDETSQEAGNCPILAVNEQYYPRQLQQEPLNYSGFAKVSRIMFFLG